MGSFGFINILDIYNNCHNMDMIELICRCGPAAMPSGCPVKQSDVHNMGGDFNWHHLLWDEERNHHLFTAAAPVDLNRLLEIVADHNMEMMLPKGLPTLGIMSMKNGTRPDIVFCSANLADKII